jgi:hypothetical protein
MTQDDNAKSAPTLGSLCLVVVPLGDGRVGVKFTRGDDGNAGILFRALKDQCDVGSECRGLESFGVFIRCPKKESAAVLLRVTQELFDSFKEE